jgi:hypothetical protein
MTKQQSQSLSLLQFESTEPESLGTAFGKKKKS